MILVVSNSERETNLLVTLCEQRTWPSQGCTTISGFTKLAEKTNPRVVIVRQRLRDGHSDDVLVFLKRPGAALQSRVIVLASPDCSISQEARQVALGADCVLRDPVKMEVLLEYLAKYRAEACRAPAPSSASPFHYEFAGAQVFPNEHRLVRLKQSIHIAPQEIELLRLLSHSNGKVVTYPVLYTELFNQRFAGDTANCRVLLGKVTSSFRQLGINLRTHIEVIPKSGYLYRADARPVRLQRPKRRLKPVKN